MPILSLHIFHFKPCLNKCHSDGRPKRMQILFYLIFNQRLSFSQLDTFLMTLPSQRSHFYGNIKPHPYIRPLIFSFPSYTLSYFLFLFVSWLFSLIAVPLYFYSSLFIIATYLKQAVFPSFTNNTALFIYSSIENSFYHLNAFLFKIHILLAHMQSCPHWVSLIWLSGPEVIVLHVIYWAEPVFIHRPAN